MQGQARGLKRIRTEKQLKSNLDRKQLQERH